MTLRKKTFLIIGITLFSLIGALYLSTHLILLSKVHNVEKQVIQHHLEWAQNSLTNQINVLDAISSDYATLNDTYQFIKDRNFDFVNSNLTNTTFFNNRINVILFFDEKNQLIYGKAVDLTNPEEVTISENLLDHLTPESIFFNPKDKVSGILQLPEAPIIVTAHPILGSDTEGSANGTIIMGHYLDPYMIQRMSQELGISLRIFDINHPYIERNKIQVSLENPIQIKELNRDQIAGYSLMPDIYNNPSMVLRIDIPRAIYQQIFNIIDFFTKCLIVGGLVIGGIILLFLNKDILFRLAKLSSVITQIGADGDLSARIPEVGNDELTHVALSINKMLTEHEKVHNQLEDIIDFLPDATFVINAQNEIIAWNRAIEEMTGISKEEMLGKDHFTYATPFYGKARPTLIDFINTDEDITTIKDKYPSYEYIERKGTTLYGEVFVPNLYNERGAHLWVTASPLYDSNDNLVGAIESIRDITKRKEAINKLTYLSLHDPLTGLYNRTHFEEELNKLNEGDIRTVGMIISDIDGLKLVNDTLGHEIGDRLLVAAANLLKKAYSEHERISRIGGDEFMILLPQTSFEEVQEIVENIRQVIKNYNDQEPEIPLNMSIGAATYHQRITSLKELFTEADNNMYHEKLNPSPDSEKCVLLTLEKALESKNYVSENISRIQYLVTNVAAALGVSNRRVKELQLFAQFRDIGKVGVSDKILFKPGPLSPEEYAEIQRHCEIGARIAQMTSLLLPISDWILKHHEWWNGKGYPLGLTGEEIPMECRLLTIADAYVAMTSDRPYRKAMSHEKAVAELSKRSGTQFDPELLERFMQVLENRDHQSKIKFLNKNGA